MLFLEVGGRFSGPSQMSEGLKKPQELAPHTMWKVQSRKGEGGRKGPRWRADVHSLHFLRALLSALTTASEAL